MGLPPLFAHGHADALMLLLDVAGPRLVDPGTGAYHAQPELRDWLRATAAHNTVEVDGRSQSTPGGLFQWLRVARVAAVELGEDSMTAAHDGYAAGAEGVMHARRVERRGATTLRIVDRLEPAAGRAAAASLRRLIVRWHVGDGRAVVRAPGAAGRAAVVEVTWPDGFILALATVLPAGGRVAVHDDAEWAPRFLAPRRCGVVEWIVEQAAPVAIETSIELGAGAVERAGQFELQPD
jgi:hypothetical protein